MMRLSTTLFSSLLSTHNNFASIVLQKISQSEYDTAVLPMK